MGRHFRESIDLSDPAQSPEPVKPEPPPLAPPPKATIDEADLAITTEGIETARWDGKTGEPIPPIKSEPKSKKSKKKRKKG